MSAAALDAYYDDLLQRSRIDREAILLFAKEAATERIRTYRLVTSGAARLANEERCFRLARDAPDANLGISKERLTNDHSAHALTNATD